MSKKSVVVVLAAMLGAVAASALAIDGPQPEFLPTLLFTGPVEKIDERNGHFIVLGQKVKLDAALRLELWEGISVLVVSAVTGPQKYRE